MDKKDWDDIDASTVRGAKRAGKFFTSAWTSRAKKFLNPGSTSEAKGTVRSTGAGRTGEKGNAPVAPIKSAKMSAGLPKAKVAVKPSAPTPAPYSKKGVADYNKDVGAFYLNATSGMFSDKAGGKKKK